MAWNIAPPNVEAIRGWDGLSGVEQVAVRRETEGMFVALNDTAESRWRVGQHLARIRDVLEPKGLFTRFLKLDALKALKISKATAYRYMASFERSKTINARVEKVALVQGLPPKKMEYLIEAHPPPGAKDVVGTAEFIDRVTSSATADSPEVMMKQCYLFVRKRWEALALEGVDRGNWMRELIGMELSLIGVGNALQLGPMAVPDSFRPAARGRPRKQA